MAVRDHTHEGTRHSVRTDRMAIDCEGDGMTVSTASGQPQLVASPPCDSVANERRVRGATVLGIGSMNRRRHLCVARRHRPYISEPAAVPLDAVRVGERWR
jgi:hypothetical protein